MYARPRGGVTYGPIGIHVPTNPVELESGQANAPVEHAVPNE